MLQSGERGIALPVTFGRTSGHAHKDHLSFDLLAFGNWLMPDIGYPEYATKWQAKDEWTNTTLSHNTVLVDGEPQKPVYSGRTRLFKQVPGLSVVTISGSDAYPQTKRYERTALLVDAPAGNGYVVDLFRVDGGKDHVYSIHGPPGTVTTAGLKPVTQPTGTYAGAEIAAETHADGFPIGYSYLTDVRRDASPAESFIVDWKAEAGYRGVTADDDIHLRLHALSPLNDVALANGKPPQNKPGNPKSLTYALLHRSAQNLRSDFVSVIEPYRTTPFITAVKRADADGRIVLIITLADGTIDRVELGDAAEPQRIAFLRETGGRPNAAALIAGSSLTAGDVKLTATAEITGRVLKMNRELAGGGWMIVDAELPTDGSLIGEHVMVANDNDRDACYRIVNVEKVPGGSRIHCGPITFVRGYLGESMKLRNQTVPRDYSRGFAYDFEEGAAFHIQMHTLWNR